MRVTGPCANPGCDTLTFGEICLGCMQQQARSQRPGSDEERERGGADELPAAELAAVAP
jgi:hypothetical protein